MGYVFVLRSEVHKLKHPHNPMAAAGAVAAAVGLAGEPHAPSSRKSQVTGLGMIQLGGKKHNDQEILL